MRSTRSDYKGLRAIDCTRSTHRSFGDLPGRLRQGRWFEIPIRFTYRMSAYGIREIRGDIVLDKSLFAHFDEGPDAVDGAGDRAYNVGPDALLVNFKALAFHFVPDPSTSTARIVVIPPVAGMTGPQTVSGLGGACGDWRGKLKADYSQPLAPRFRGGYPLSCGARQDGPLERCAVARSR